MSQRDQGEDGGQEETIDRGSNRPVQISVTEERSRELEQQTQSFLSVMQALIPEASTSHPVYSGAGASLGSFGNMEPSGLSSRGGNNRDGLFSSPNFPILQPIGIASIPTAVRMSSSNPLPTQPSLDLPGEGERPFVPPGNVSEENPSASVVSSTSQQSLGELSDIHGQEAPPSDEEDEDDVGKPMTEQHRELLTLNRAELVNDMTPDEIFNSLIAEKIFTTADVSRIKGSNRIREQMNEELLDCLARRPDGAFHVFKDALEKTLQGHLSDLLDPNKNLRFKTAQKRKQDRLAAQHNSPSAKVKRLPPSASITSTTSTSTSSSTVLSSAPPATNAFITSTEETAPPNELTQLESDVMSFRTRPFALHSSISLAVASEGVEVGSSAFWNRQESVALRASLVELIGSQGFREHEEQHSSLLGSQFNPSLARHYSREVFRESGLHADEVDNLEPEREAGAYEEAKLEAGSETQGMEVVFSSYLELENRFMEMARNAYAQLSPRDGTEEAFQQFMMEYIKTNQHLETTVQLLSSLKDVCRWHPNHSD